jgi:enamine deaminase RidA (YjgF/YER057c/UK114 family)
MKSLSTRLKELSIEIPPVAGPFGAYVPAKRVGDLLYVSGQLPMKDGQLMAIGQVPSRTSVEAASFAAKQCVINALGAVAAIMGSVDCLAGVAKVGVFVSSDPSFTQQPLVANGASEFLVELFGDPGRHARAAIGAAVLPRDAAVEVEFIFELAGIGE